VPLFGKREPAVGQKLRVVPRQPGDTTPLSAGIAEALRKAGMDPDQFTVAPGDPGAAALSGLPPAGSSLEHAFLFTDRADALRCVETFADRGRPVTITPPGEACAHGRTERPNGPHAEIIPLRIYPNPASIAL